MEFAKAQLKKYGWSEGKGLGKDESGITQAIKPKLKFDNSGIGYDGAENFTYFWWQHAFDTASKNISVSKKEDDVSVNASQEFDISTKKISAKKKKGLVLNTFLKSATTLTNKGIVRTATEEDEEITEVLENRVSVNDCPLTDEELFKACGGRTAHKGARYGLKLSGKLARVAEQERKLLAKMSGVTQQTKGKEKQENELNRATNGTANNDEHVDDVRRKHKKKKYEEISDNTQESGNEDRTVKKKKKIKEMLDNSEDEMPDNRPTQDVSEDGRIKKKKKIKEILDGEEGGTVGKQKKWDSETYMPVNSVTLMSEVGEIHNQKCRPMMEEDCALPTGNDTVTVKKRKKSKRKINSEILGESLEPQKMMQRQASDSEEIQHVDLHKKKKKKKRTEMSEEIQGDNSEFGGNACNGNHVSITDIITKKAKKSKRKGE